MRYHQHSLAVTEKKSPNVVQIPQGPKIASLSGVCKLLHVALVLWIVAGDVTRTLLFIAVININILICNFASSLERKINEGGKTKIYSWDIAVLWITHTEVQIKETINVITFS